MPSYAAAGSNGSMESWYPLGAFVESRIWAQMMRQISRRAADVGITCNWRNGLVNPGAAVQYPDDDFLVGLGEHPITVCQEYMEQIFGMLEDVCEATYLDDCKLWFFAPNEGTLPFCSGLDGVEPMVFTQPTLVEDRRKWKNWMTRMRQVVDALDRLKTVWPIPHPATLYTLQTSWSSTYSKQGYYLGGPVIAGVPRGTLPGPYGPFPTGGDGYCLDPAADHAFPGFDALDGDSGALTAGRLGVVCIYEYPLWYGQYGVVDASSTGPRLRSWAGRGKLEATITAKFDDDDWAEFVAQYGSVVNSIPWTIEITPTLVPYSEEADFVGISVTNGGDASVVLTANAEVEFSQSWELSVDATEYVLFKDGDYSTRVAKCATFWLWHDTTMDFLGVFLGDSDPLPIPVNYTYQPALYYNANVDEITACDI